MAREGSPPEAPGEREERLNRARFGAFSLTFYDAGDTPIGQAFAASGIAGINDQTFPLGAAYPDVSYVELRVTSGFAAQIEFREIAFEGY